ncbi:MAG: M48 family metalloprotease [Methylophaga sp.]|nr:M48 family metalloprotease [Methylophaga sp.]
MIMKCVNEPCSVRSKLQSLGRMVGALLFLGLLTACAQNPVTGGRDFVMLSENQELEIGRQYHPRLVEQYGLYPDEALQAYVQELGERLAAASHRDHLVYRFTVLDSPIVNAFALPGGYIYITRGLMAYLNSEAELAAVLGHEIGHVTARHGVRQASAAQAANLGYTIGAILVPELRAAPSQQLFNVLGGALLSGYGREHELEADRLGAEYLARTGYKPQAMIDVIGVLKDQATFAEAEARKQGREYQGYHGIFATHPDNDTRLQQVVLAANRYANLDNARVGREDYLRRIQGMVFGDSEEQGIRSGNKFFHRDMRFALTFPENWHIENNPDSLIAIAPGGHAVIQMGASDLNRRQTPAEFIEDRLKISRLQDGQVVRSNGLEGYTGLTTMQGRQVRVTVMYLRDRAFIFVGGARESRQFIEFDKDVLETARSLQELTPEQYHLARAHTIEVVTVGPDDTYEKWARESPITNSPESQLRLLNGDYPDGQLIPGTLAKRIRGGSE